MSLSARSRYLAFRRSLPRPPRLEKREVTARGLRFAVFTTPAVAGSTPLLCVNGGLLFSHELLWPALSPLAGRRQLIFYDQRGRGESQAPSEPRAARIEDDAADIPALRESLGLGRWDLLGHSWGGGIALLAAERDRDAVRRIVTVNAVGPDASWMAVLHDTALARLDAAERAVLGRFSSERLGSDDPDVQSAYARALYPAWFAERDLADYFAPPRSTSATGAAVAARLRREGYDWTQLLSFLARPALVIHGDLDLLSVDVARKLEVTLPRARAAIVPGSGHMPFWEAPERFFTLVEAFLSAPDAELP